MLTPERREYERLRAARRRAIAKKLGLCQDCNTRKAEHGVRCLKCHERERQYSKRTWKEKKDKRMERGLYPCCGRPRLFDDGFKCCPICCNPQQQSVEGTWNS